MNQTRISIIDEVSIKLKEETLCLQYCIYDYGDNDRNKAYRFIRRDPEGRLKPQRGQAGIPNLELVDKLLKMMREVQIPVME